jgi:hypothetical protein
LRVRSAAAAIVLRNALSAKATREGFAPTTLAS